MVVDMFAPAAHLLAVRGVEESFRCTVPEPDDGLWCGPAARPEAAPSPPPVRSLTMRERVADRLHALADHIAPSPQASPR